MRSSLPILDKKTSAPSLMVESYPDIKHYSNLHDEKVEDHFKVILSIIHASRSLRQGNQISVGKELPFTILCSDPQLLNQNGPLKLYMNEIQNFVKASNMNVLDANVSYFVNT